ncbi:MAG: hypothetical protein H7X77_07135, partial [Anaerolineae bacterium]|nr:hypothetical protein [Anaerolineae bacterium]
MKTRDSDRITFDLVAQAQALFKQQVTDPVVLQHVQEMNRLLTHWQVRTPVLVASWLLVIVRNELIPDNELATRFGNRALQIARLACKLIFTDIASDTVRRGSPKAAYADLVR